MINVLLEKENTMATKKENKTAPKQELANVTPGKSIIDKNSGKQVVNWNFVEPQVRDKMMDITNGLRQAFADVRVGVLKIGALLSEAEMIMKPRGLWVNYLNSFPNFKQAQAYRYINGYLVAQKHFPPAVLDVILSTGMDMIGTKDRPFGKYQDVVKMLPPPKDADTGKATAWLNQVEARYRESRKKGSKEVNTASLQKDAFLAITKKYSQVPERNQLQWLRKLFGCVLGYYGMKQDETITPVDPPADWIKRTGEKTDKPEQGE